MTSAERRIRRRMRRFAKRNKNKQNFLQTVNDATKVFSFWHLLNAGLRCCRSVRWKASVQKFEMRLISNCWKITIQIFTYKWKPKRASHFLLFDAGKLRQIDSVNIWTRVVQCCLCFNCLMPIAERSAVNDSYSSRPNKGTDYAISKFVIHLEEAKATYELFYIYIFDFSKFFASILHEPLRKLLSSFITDPVILYVIDQIMQLFGERGLQLGSHFSQSSAVLLGVGLDNCIKSQYATKGYGRYSDDGFIIDNDYDRLLQKVKCFTEKASYYGLSINQTKAKILTSNDVLHFLKKRYKFNGNRVYVRIINKSVTKTHRRIKRLFKKYDAGKISVDDILVSYNTWANYAIKYNSKRSVRNVQQYVINKLVERGISYAAQRYQVCAVH